jgi:predicted lipid-binding transport protein (Tim44 family)
MMVNSQLFEILIAATVAGVILFRLYTVLGRRTGHERPPQEKFSGNPAPQAPGDNVVALPDRAGARAEVIDERPADPVARGLLDIKLADRAFEAEHFLSGSRAAYEMIVTAFAGGDRSTLRPLLSEEVFAAFDEAMRGRDERKEHTAFTFVGFKDTKIVHAALKTRMAEITVAFGAQFISATSDANGTVIEGDAKSVRDVTDVWTFAHDVRARDPNWTLVATSGDLP